MTKVRTWDGQGAKPAEEKKKPPPKCTEDAEDLRAGAKYIPTKVTTTRETGGCVSLIRVGRHIPEWYWLLPNGDTIKHGWRNM